jgi:hypothetical protein
MRARHPIAALCVSIFSLLAFAGAAQAYTPITVNVRIEGNTETLFEGPVSVTPHNVQATSDTVERRCDGINKLDPWNVVPNPTATSASVDAMSLLGETFDGQWYPGYDDYFIKRFGPDAEKEGKSWGILVNNVFTNVGGCQYQLTEGDEVLWAFDAFNFRPFLALFPAGYSGGSRPLTATATLGQPFEVEVDAYEDDSEDVPPEHPERAGSAGFEGADVSPVVTQSNGFEKVATSDPATVVTNSQGKASITFSTPGWHRIKATVPGAHEEEVIRSNRLDVCVPAVGQTDCGALPADDEVRVPQATLEAPAREAKEQEEREEREAQEAEEAEEREEREAAEKAEREAREKVEAAERQAREATEAEERAVRGAREAVELKERQAHEAAEAEAAAKAAAAAPAAGTGAPPAASTAAVRLSVPAIDRKGLRQGRIGLSWKVIETGAGVKSWTISSQALSRKKAPYVKRASGTTATSASLHLPRGSYRLRLTVTDALGRTASVTIGKVVVPGGRG